jgi:hypothetical protein
LNWKTFEVLGFYLSRETGRVLIILVVLAVIGLVIACRDVSAPRCFALLWIFVPLFLPHSTLVVKRPWIATLFAIFYPVLLPL